MEIAETVIYLLVGLVVFVTGMNMMSHGLKTSAGRFIRRIFKKIKNNRLISTGIGAGTTALIQSSGATTVMVVGFLSAGALTFAQGFSIMLGAFIGTTVTGVLVSLSNFSFAIFLMALAFVGFVLGFFKNVTVKSIGEILVGFGILFFGLEAMKGAFNNPDIQKALVEMISSINFPLLLLLIGTAITAVTQSSSATNGIVIMMVAANPSLLSSGFYLVLGATIGAMLPALIACAKANNLARRVTYTTFICRILGATIATCVVWACSTPLFNWISSSFSNDGSTIGIILAVFTVIYNIIYVAVMLPLITPIEKLSVKMFKDKDEEKKKKSLLYLNDNLLNTPSIAIIQVKKEIEHMLKLSEENFCLGLEAIYTQDLSKSSEAEEREETIDYLNNVISEYLIKLSANASLYDETLIGAYYHVINDVERIGDHAYNFVELAKKMKDEDLVFSSAATEELKYFEQVLKEMFELSNKLFMESDVSLIHQLQEKEDITDSLKVKFTTSHFERIKQNVCKNELSVYHSTLLSELERVADHLTNIGYSIINPTGDVDKHSLELE